MLVHVEEKRMWGAVAVLEPCEAFNRGVATWTLKRLRGPSDIFPEKTLVKILSEILETFRIKKAYAPSASASNAEIISTAERGWIPIGYPKKPKIMRNPTCPADGVVLNPGNGFIISTAGCPIIVATGRGEMIVARAGRDSLIDRVIVDEREGMYPRAHPSVVDSIVASFGNMGVPAGGIHMHAFFAIPSHLFTHRFDHPTYGRYNRRLYEFVSERWMSAIAGKTSRSFCLSLNNLIMAQAHNAGVGSVTASHSITDHPELAHTHDGQNKNRRNLVIVRCAS